jgi:hypothetical protein
VLGDSLLCVREGAVPWAEVLRALEVD